MNEFSSARFNFARGLSGQPAHAHSRSTSSTSTGAVVLNTIAFTAPFSVVVVCSVMSTYPFTSTARVVSRPSRRVASRLLPSIASLALASVSPRTRPARDDTDRSPPPLPRRRSSARSARAPSSSSSSSTSLVVDALASSRSPRVAFARAPRTPSSRAPRTPSRAPRRRRASLWRHSSSRRVVMHGRRRQTVDERDARRRANAARVGAFKALEVRRRERAKEARKRREHRTD